MNLKHIIEEGEKEISGEGNILWKVLNEHLTPETQSFIQQYHHQFALKLIAGFREMLKRNKGYKHIQWEGVNDFEERKKRRVYNEIYTEGSNNTLNTILSKLDEIK